MGTFEIPNTLTNGETADANEVMADLNAIRSFVLADTVHTDGANEMDGALTLKAGAPTGARHAAHKGYVDGQREVAKTYADTQIDTALSGPFVHLTAWVDGDYDIDGDPDNAQPAGGENGWSGWVNIKFDHTVADVGNAYDQANDRFVAPKAGLYLVSVTAGGSAGTKFSTRLVVGPSTAADPANDANRIYFGPRWTPADIVSPLGPAPLSFSHVVKVDAAGWWIRPQFHAVDAGSYRFGKTLTIAWLHA